MVTVESLDTASQEANGVRMYLLGAWYWIGTHVSLTIALIGVLFVVLGATVLTGIHAVFSGMFGVWGGTLVVLGLISELVFRAIARYQHRSVSTD